MTNSTNQRDDYGEEFRPSPRHLRPTAPSKTGPILVVIGGVLILVAIATGLAVLLYTNIN